MKQFQILKALPLLGIFSLTQFSVLGNSQDEKKDVLFISIEDAGPHRFSIYGNEVCKTPNIDYIAKQGVKFEHAFASASPCNPSRASLLSGLRPETTGILRNGDDWSRILEPGSTMPEHFRDNGYETTRIGKIFHMGSRDEHGNRILYDDADRWSQIIDEDENIPPRIHEHRPLMGDTALLRRNKELQAQGKKRIRPPFLYGPSGLDPIEHADGRIAEQAVRFLKKNHDKPLFLALGFHSPHLPFTAPDKYFDMYPQGEIKLPDNSPDDLEDTPLSKHKDQDVFNNKDKWREAIAAHYATITFVDDQIGRVIDVLKETGRLDNTIIVVWTDHGFQLGEHYRWRKGDLFDHAAQSLLIMMAPGVTSPGSVCERPVESIDIFPTLCDVTGIPVPSGLEGISMEPLLREPARPWKKGALTVKRDQGKSIRTRFWRYNEYYENNQQSELYDHIADPGEYNNLADEEAYSDHISYMSKLINQGWKATLPDTVSPEYPLYAIASGDPDATDEDLQTLARRFSLVQGDFTKEEIGTLHDINPDFKALNYINSSYTTKPHHVPLVEGKFRRALTMFPAAELAGNIDEDDNKFLLKPAPENQNRSIALKGSTLEGKLSSGDPDKPSTQHYVTWIQIGDEYMRIEAFDSTTNQIRVSRGFDNSTPSKHLKGDLVFSPVYLGSQNLTGAWPGGPGSKLRYAFDPSKPEAGEWISRLAVNIMNEGYDGVWLDIMSASAFNLADSYGRKVKPWNFIRDDFYNPDEYRKGHERKVHFVQQSIRGTYGNWPVLVANNMQPRNFEVGDGGLRKLLESTSLKPRPLDGYCIEGFAGGFYANLEERKVTDLEYHPVDKWKENVQLVMKCAQEGLAAYPMASKAGSKSLLIEPWGKKRDHFEYFAYASYLLAIEEGSPTRLGIPVFYQRGGERYADLYPIYIWPVGAPAETVSSENLETYRIENYRSYMRHFENGIVLVNPTNEDDGHIKLNRTYIDPRNGKKVDSIHMDSHTGRILLDDYVYKLRK
jgi:uncharacterized sulfatase